LFRVSSRGFLAQQQVHLVVTVEVVFVGTVPELHPFQELLLDVRVAGGTPVKLIIVGIARIEGAPRI
jgi:hypothetical protein